MVTLRPLFLSPSDCCRSFCENSGNPGFVCHPATSELAELLMVDPESLARENYSGLYDENGDTIPQYCDDPEKLPRSVQMQANFETPPVESASPGETKGQETGESTSSGESVNGE